MQYRLIVIALAFLLITQIGRTQSLNDFIRQAITNSYYSEIAKNNYRIAEAELLIFKSSNHPTLSLYGDAPVFNKDNYGVTQPDGTIKFLRRSQNYSTAGLSIAQPIPYTGGTVSINTELYRFDDFESKTKQYSGTPVFVQLNQPVFAFNKYKWDKKIEPLKIEESNLTFRLQMNELAYEICKAYFEVIEAQIAQELAAFDWQTSSENIAIEKRRLQLGTSTEDKVLQLEILQMTSEQQLEQAKSDKKQKLLLLRNLIKSTDTSNTILPLPENLPTLPVNKNEVIEEAKKQLPAYLSFQRKNLEAKSGIDAARLKDKQINLVASYGLTNTASYIGDIYQNPKDQQRFSIGFNVPISSFGKRKSTILLSKLQADRAELENKDEESRLLAELTNLVDRHPLLQRNLLASEHIDTLTQRRFAITNRLYQSGKASLLELQASQVARNNSRKNYISALRQFWEAWFLLKVKINAPIEQ